MIVYDMYAADQRNNNFVLYEELGGDGPLRLRPRYSNRACPECGKVDEYGAIVTCGVDRVVSIKARTDVVGTTDNIFMCFSKRAQGVVADQGVKGLAFFPLPCGEYSVAIPTIAAVVDLAGAKRRKEIQCIKRCRVCKRYKETGGGISFRSITLPSDPLEIATLSFPSESRLGRRECFYLSSAAARIFKRAKLSGIDYGRYEV